MNLHTSVFFYIIYVQGILTSRVLELTDRFPEIRKDGGMWLVQFYAPWCGHCKKLEPIWMHVAQALAKTNIRVGKVDVTRFPSVANEFKAYGTPTIKFLKPDSEHTFYGDRSKDVLVNYAIRMSLPPVQEITKSDVLNNLKNENQLFFMYIGKREGPLWDVYYTTAVYMQPYVYFYCSSEDVAKQHVNIHELPAVFVHKEGVHYFYPVEEGNGEEEVIHLNKTLYKWVNEERFETFPKITSDNINEYMQTKKYLVLVIVEENKINEIPPDMLEFRSKVENLIRNKRDVYHKYFQFGWMGNPSVANSIAMVRLPLPYLLVFNSSTYHHHIPDDDPVQMTSQAIEVFLERIINSTSPAYGGNTIAVNTVRKILNIKRELEDMWQGNPVMVISVVTLPSLFFMLIVYTCCCSDLLDAEEEDEEELLYHEKNE
ncbi:protein disulfide-isomerase TMX3 [Sitophilus oryzae]|uniref:Protein disulfide-isomerase TMX3 n=1 Tax=Sitophilus oryzae TaxID=7048 RepID=A0A6J2XEI8_SITOR|nr:protein disulfide-isomerase TMX3 [Sitophilus oryzae]